MSQFTLDADEHEFTIDYFGGNVGVSKVGGGTIGRAYEGFWHYTIVPDQGEVITGSDLFTGTPKNHQEAADLVLDFTFGES
jgi:hypothetical protein